MAPLENEADLGGGGLIFGVDSNILCYALDPAYVEHPRCGKILAKLGPKFRAALNPTILHETYHVLVFGQKWVPGEAEKRLRLILRHPHVEFHNQTKRVSLIALSLATKHGMGGRDSLITANLLSNKVPVLYTHDDELLKLRKIDWGISRLKFEDPVAR